MKRREKEGIKLNPKPGKGREDGGRYSLDPARFAFLEVGGIEIENMDCLVLFRCSSED